MLYSRSAHQSGSSGFFFADDRNAPDDSISVSDADVQAAINLPLGSTYDFDANGHLTTTAPSDATLLDQAKASQIAAIISAYQIAITQPVSFTTAAGVEKVFQADKGSQDVLETTTQGYSLAGAVPSGFYWVASDNTQVPFTLADLKGLYAAMLAQGWAAFQKLQTLKAEVRAAASPSAALAVVWS